MDNKLYRGREEATGVGWGLSHYQVEQTRSGGEQWSDSGCILRAESIGFPDGLDVRYERERHWGTSKVSA